ncbi:hypothetical protein E8E11_002655 [Didymella keratinophila]|nr:hypothetical protein E8E11_002655 [Didymella keratinophila]
MILAEMYIIELWVTVQDSISTALVLKDDADWDVLLRPQLASLARGLRYLQGGTTPHRSPYGDAWDILAIGHNGLNNRLDKDQKYYVTRKDPTVIAEARRTWSRKPDLSAPELDGEYTRVVMEISRFTSLTAYALSLRGAAQLLHNQALLPNAKAIDVSISYFCSRQEYGRPATARVWWRSGEGRQAVAGERVHCLSRQFEHKKLMKGETVLPADDQEKDTLKSVDLKTFVMPPADEVFVKQDKQ